MNEKPILHVLTKSEAILSQQLREKTAECIALQDANGKLFTYLTERADAGCSDMEGADVMEFIKAETIMCEAVKTLAFLGYKYNPITQRCEFVTSKP